MLSLDVLFLVGVQKVDICVNCQESIIDLIVQTWATFFFGGPALSEEILPDLASQPQREDLCC
jgi:hypothetical protein